MRRAFFFIVAIFVAVSSFASIPRAVMLDRAADASALRDAPAETRIWASDVLAPFTQPGESGLTRALRQAYEQASMTNTSGSVRFLSVDPGLDVKKTVPNPQMWNRYAYVQNNPLKYVDADGKDALAVFLTGDERYRNVSTWDVMMSGETVSDVKRAWNDFLEDHRSMTHGMSPFPTSKGEVGITAAMVMIGPLGGPLRGFLGTTFSEAKTLVGAWGKGTFPTLAKTIAYHFAEHGEEVGAKSALQYLRKAYEFNRNLRGAETKLLENGATRYTKNGYYIIKDVDGHILSYGVAR
jgi:RHS repeat-associated protein